jgi:hypothetical protein
MRILDFVDGFESDVQPVYFTAANIAVTPTGGISSTDVQSALAELDTEKQPVDSDLTAVAGLATTGLIARTGTGAASTRTISPGSTKVAITNGDGVSGNPTVDVTEANLTLSNIGGSVTPSQLPNPSATTKGGVKSLAAASHQFLTSIGTDGTPAQAQPAFSDISGSVAAAQLPNPTSSSLGGVQSAAPVSHQWVTSISTSGVPALSQPAFSDISGSANLTTQVTGTLPVGNGGTGQTAFTDGQLLIGNTATGLLSKAVLTAGTNITITNGNGSIQIAASAAASPAWNYTSQTTTYSAVIMIGSMQAALHLPSHYQLLPDRLVSRLS